MILIKTIFVFLFAIIFCVSLFVDAEAKIYIDEEYNFWIEYPDNWAIDDKKIYVESVPGVNSGTVIFPTFRDGVYWWEHFVSISLQKNSSIAINYEGEKLLDFVANELKKGCELASFDYQGYQCANHETLKKEIINVNGMTAYQITDSWIEKYPDDTSTKKISIVTNFVIGSNLWQIDSIMLESRFDHGIKITQESIQSFRFLDKAETIKPIIPEWVRNNAHWWADDQISDDEFVHGLQYLIKEEIIIVPYSIQESTDESSELPTWIKNNAGWWADGLISDDSFIEGIQWMIKQNIIKLS